ncbi:hypothetical protein FLORINDA_55 [Mycobacterium phage Florinda]|uniref:Uncharacterized protein n=1 Tax=Mycobacterium phage Florinda TaxID=1675549 RepID=A0A0K1LSB2_9CAUD|nr:transcriptional repressor [Mycobacterium phage Florinda]AKU45025.1 hypothetical protein FLORINDA_55 [Mycobacterium phage Florinda]
MRQQCVYAADMPNEELMKWIDKRIADANTTAAAIADKAGINKSTITKWRGGSQPRPRGPADGRKCTGSTCARGVPSGRLPQAGRYPQGRSGRSTA